MGMFDYVTGVEINCPKCGKPLSEFQSKDGNCQLEKIHYTTVDCFYENCDGCDTWVEFRKTEDPDRIVPGYDLVVNENESGNDTGD